MLRISDAALLIRAHEHRQQDFEQAAYSVLGQVQHEQDLRDEQTAHIYAVVVESCNAQSTAAQIEEAIRRGFQTRPQ